MGLLANLRLGPRIGAGFGLCIVLLLAVAGIGLVNLKRMNDDTQSIIKNDWQKAKLVTTALDNTRGSIARLFQLVQAGQSEDAARARERLEANLKATQEAMVRLEPLLLSERGRQLLAQAKTTREAYFKGGADVSALIEQGRVADASRLAYGGTYAALQAFANDLRELNEYQQQLLERSGEQSAAAFKATLWLILGLSGAAVGLAAFAAWVVTRSVTQPVARAVHLAEAVAAGDLTSRIDAPGRDEVAQLLRALQRMNESLNRIVSDVRQASDSIATGSSQIATGNVDLSQRTEEQASNLQQTAASMEQLTSTVKNNADTARQATQLASSASVVAEQGGAVVARVVETMQQIQGSSRRIADIIGVIDGIAFQTNILALNAAVEAARAGEQGRGFAVVAGEVRTLAQRSAQAAREIKTLIGESVERVETGGELVGDAGRTMSDIVAQVKRVSDLIGEISAASGEQTAGISQIGDAVAQLDQVTQQNAALVEESTAASESLRHQAVRLAQAVAVFRVAEGAASPAEASAPAQRPAAAARPAPVAPVAPVAASPAAKAAVADEWVAH